LHEGISEAIIRYPMSEQSEKPASQRSDSGLLAEILEELRHIRSQLDLVLEPEMVDLAPIAPLHEAGPPRAPATVPPPLPGPAEVAVVEIAETEIVQDASADADAASRLSDLVEAQEASRASDESPATTAAGGPPPVEVPQRPQAPPPEEQADEIPSFDLPKHATQEEQARLFVVQKRRIEDMMSLAQFARAEKLAQALLSSLPHWDEAEALLETVRRESTAFRREQQTRLFGEFQKWTESRQWTYALAVGEQLLAKYPACDQAQRISATMATVRSNAHFQEARILRDRISDLVRRKRFSEAVKVAEDVVVRFPNTRVAKQLRSLIPNMKRRGGEFR